MARLHLEHGALALLLVPTPTASLVDEIRSTLTRNNEMEEGNGGIYDACDRLLCDEMEAVVEQLRTVGTHQPTGVRTTGATTGFRSCPRRSSVARGSPRQRE